MKRCTAVILAALPVAGVFVVATSGGATEPAGGDRVARELAGLNRSLESVVAVLERLERKQDLALLLRRIELKERRLLPREQALRSSSSTLENMRSDLEQLRHYRESVREQISSAIREGAVGPEADEIMAGLRRQEAEAVNLLDSRTKEVEALELRRQVLEDEVAEQREEVEILEERLDAFLEEEDR
jgi:chromosome segregation ATPase